MKIIQKKKILIIWLNESNKKAKEVEEGMLQDMMGAVWKKLQAM